MKYLQDSNPVEVSEFSLERGVESEPTFVWWLPYTLRKIDMLIYAVIAIKKRVSHKYGVKLQSIV